MKVHPATVGPIVGYTSGTETRIWLRGEFKPSSTGYVRCFVAARTRPLGVGAFSPPVFNKAVLTFDMTAVCVLEGLLPDTGYEVEAGWFLADTDLDNLPHPDTLDWTASSRAQLRTGPESSVQARSYAIGSCRYMARLFGQNIFDDRSDKVFREIQKQLDDPAGPKVDAVVLLGDQIYGDDLGPFGKDFTFEDYTTRYRAAFSQPHFRSLAARVPMYMILDDHEIENNWPEKNDGKKDIQRSTNALMAYQAYQCSHSPLMKAEGARISERPKRYWYTFQDGCCDWFMMDVRTERIWSEKASARRIISPEQMDKLLEWLNDGSGRVKMVGTSVPFFPDPKNGAEDKWAGFIPERTKILDFILSKGIRKVVFLSGDVHASMAAQITSPSDTAFKVTSVVSSPIFWPVTLFRGGKFQTSGKLKAVGGGDYRVVNATDVHDDDGFGRIEVTPSSIKVQFFTRRGDPVSAPVTFNL